MKLRRTLLTAGVFALLAMVYVPTPAQRFVHPGYRFIFSSEDTSIAFFQLLVNVALLGAILSAITPKIVTGVRKLPRWVLRGIAGIVISALITIGVVAVAVACLSFTEAAKKDERYANELLRGRHDVFDQAVVEFHFRNAARNWRFALRFDEATRVENRIRELQQHPAQAWRSDPVVDLSGLPDQTAAQAPQASGHSVLRPSPSPDIFDQAAKDLGFVPDTARQPAPTPKKYISTDPNAGEPIPRARPVRSPSSQLTFDDLIPARTATPASRPR